MNLAILAGNIKRIRTAQKVSQLSLAQCAGLSVIAIKKIEAADHAPRLSTLQAIAKALNIRLQQLFLPVPTLTAVRFRANKKVQGRDQILAKVQHWLNDYHFLESSLNDHKPYRLSEIAVANKRRINPKELAIQARKLLEIKVDEPISDICGLLEHAGIKALPYHYASDSFFGLSVGPSEKGPAIVVNTWERISIERQVFSAAHELGHLLMHLQSFHYTEIEENKTEEDEANQFAGQFLMPDAGFLQAWNDAAGLHVVDRVMKVKSIFRVSYKAVLWRLIEQKKATSDVWVKFPAAYLRRYNKKLAFKEEPSSETSEPDGMSKFAFYENRLSRLVRTAIEQESISISRGAEILNMPIDQLQDQLNGAEVLF